MNIQELLDDNGIRIDNLSEGEHPTTCPRCSAGRQPAHRSLKCLSVRIENDRACWHCNHCGWSGPEKGSGKGNGKDRDPWPSFLYAGGALRKVKKPKGSKPPPYYWQHLDESGEWARGDGGIDTSSMLYQIEEAREAIKAGQLVLTVEGEKDVDRLRREGFTATCNAHGASDPTKRQRPKWTAAHSEHLRGADMVVFPDNDAPGYAHAEATCQCSVGVAKRVRRIDLKDHWPDIPPGGDISDWFDAGHTRDELAKLIAGAQAPSGPQAQPPGSSSPSSGAAPDDSAPPKKVGFRMTDQGLLAGHTRLSQSFEIVALARDAASADDATGWSTVIRFRNPDGAFCETPVSKAALIKEPNAALAALADRGMDIETKKKARDFLVYSLNKAEPKERQILARRVGWIDGEKPVFLLPDEIIGRASTERVIWIYGAHCYDRLGTLDQWREKIAAPAGEHRLLRFSIATAFAGTLLHLGGFESGIFHLYGFSSAGKTTCQRVAASVWGSGADGAYVRPWRTTVNALETTLASACDTFLPLDEVGQAEGRDLRAAAYMITGATGKARMSRDASAKASHKWRTIALSSGEKPLAQLLRDGQNAPRAGQLVRAIDIPVNESAFDNPYPDFDPKAFADQMKIASTTVCGQAGREFVRQLIARNITGEDVRRRVADFVEDATKGAADQGQAARVAERFGLVATAGELAIKLGVLPWPQGKPTEDGHALFAQWTGERGGLGPVEPEQIVAHVRRLIEMHGDSRFDDLEPLKNKWGDELERRPVVNRMGYRKGSGNDQRWMVLPEVWRAEFCAGYDPAKVAEVLVNRAMLEKGEGRQLGKKVSVEGVKMRLYVLTPTIFDNED